MAKFSIFHVEGGLGKNIASTPVVKAIKLKYPDRKLIVTCSYPEIFLNNEYVDRVLPLGHTPYFYQDYIEDKDTIFFRQEPYNHSNHISKKTPIHETWFSMYDLEYDKDKIEPYIPMNMVQFELTRKYRRNKPIFLIHTGGGMHEGQDKNYTWTRDMPPSLAIDATNAAISNGYHVIQITRDDGYTLDAAEVIKNKIPNMELFAILLNSNKRLLIDSCLQHASSAFKLPSTVCWVGTSPEMFGYNLHTNIVANKPKIKPKMLDSYLFDYDFSGHYHQCPYRNDKEIFDTVSVIKTLELNSNQSSCGSC